MLMTYGAWGWVTTWLAAQTLWLAVPLTGLLIALHSSLQHEAIHGHPFADQRLNAALASPFDIGSDHRDLTRPPTEEEIVPQTFCGT